MFMCLQERAQRQEELKRLKRLRQQEVAARLAQLQEAAGGAPVPFHPAHLEGDFDSAQHDQLMEASPWLWTPGFFPRGDGSVLDAWVFSWWGVDWASGFCGFKQGSPRCLGSAPEVGGLEQGGPGYLGSTGSGGGLGAWIVPLGLVGWRRQQGDQMPGFPPMLS